MTVCFSVHTHTILGLFTKGGVPGKDEIVLPPASRECGQATGAAPTELQISYPKAASAGKIKSKIKMKLQWPVIFLEQLGYLLMHLD